MKVRLARRALPGIFLLSLTLRLGGGGMAQEQAPVGPLAAPAALASTALLEARGDVSADLVAGVDRFLRGEIAASVAKRARHWARDLSSPQAYSASIAANRERFARIIGLRDGRHTEGVMEIVGSAPSGAVLARGRGFDVFSVRWPAFRQVTGRGLLLVPSAGPLADVVALPDADQTPEQLAGLVEGVPAESQVARRLAEIGCRVLVPALISRDETPDGISYREWIYRPAFVLGRHVIGYEVLKILAGIDYLQRTQTDPRRKIGVAGWGEGGLLAFYAAAVDERIDAAWVSGYFAPRQEVWDEPAYRNVFGLLDEFGDAEVATLIAPRALVVEAAPGPEIVVPARGHGQDERWSGRPANGKPGRIATPPFQQVNAELQRARDLLGDLSASVTMELIAAAAPGSKPALAAFLKQLTGLGTLPEAAAGPADIRRLQALDDATRRHEEQVRELVDHNEWALRESSSVRDELMKGLDFTSLTAYKASVESYRTLFREDVIGRFDRPLLDARPRSRKYQENAGVTSYEVVLDVFPGVIAYGILSLPDDLRPGERRPVVVCQHGLEARPQAVIGPPDHPIYKAFATRLAQRGFVTFAPQNLYLGHDEFRSLQFKSNSIKKTLFSIMVAQHQQIVSWLSSLDFVDRDRIAFYGISYGGKAAMRITPLVGGYCLAICSADFNDWIWKTCSTHSRYSYAQKGEYEIFEWNLGNTFSYAEMAALIAPRPFMVERGHFDEVAPDDKVAQEFAKVRRLYGLLGIGDRAEIEWFAGPHTINGRGTFDFLRRHLGRPGTLGGESR